MSGNAPEFKAELEKRGLTVKSPQITGARKGGGYILHHPIAKSLTLFFRLWAALLTSATSSPWVFTIGTFYGFS